MDQQESLILNTNRISFSWLKPTKGKIGFFVIFLILSALAVWLLIGVFSECLFSMGCDRVSFIAFLANVLGSWLVLPVYYFIGDFFQPMNLRFLQGEIAGYIIFGILEIVYLYVISCLVIGGINWYRNQKQVARTSIIAKTSWMLWLPWLFLFYDFSSLPRRISYVVASFGDAGFYIANIDEALKIFLFALIELVYFIFLFKNRRRIPWGKFMFWLILVFDGIFCLLNFWMIIVSFIRN